MKEKRIEEKSAKSETGGDDERAKVNFFAF